MKALIAAALAATMLACCATGSLAQNHMPRITPDDGPNLPVIGGSGSSGPPGTPDQAPGVTITAPLSGSVFSVNTSVGFTGAFTDDPRATHSARWSFGAMAAPGAVTESSRSVAASWTFRAAGVYPVSLAVTDQAGRTSIASKVNGRAAAVVVYDPAAGSLKAHGRIESPAGALTANPRLATRADFQIDCKYPKGATAPTGSSQFKLEVGRLDFRGNRFEWLVISGASVQLRGSGKVNGRGAYDILLAAVDGDVSGGGGVDRVRVRIINRATGAVVYDNQMGASDAAAPTASLDSGSIQIVAAKVSKPAGADLAPRVEPALAAVGFSLAQNAPNPFRARTEVRFTVPRASQVKIGVYDVAGRAVASLADGAWEAGAHSVSWTGMTAAGAPARGGVYFVRMFGRPVSGGQAFVSTRKMVLVE
jgi:PKD repeat protein